MKKYLSLFLALAMVLSMCSFASAETKEEILAYCRKNIAKYAVPREIEFREELPKTLVGKVAYRILEEEEEAKYQAKLAAKAAKEQKSRKK